MNGHVALATGLALLTASLYACSNVLKLLEAEQVPSEYAMKLGLLARLVRRPRWLIGIGCDACGYVTHAAALALAAVVFVEPLLATGILLSLFVGAAFVHRPVRPAGWASAIVLSAGLAVFLYEVAPTGGNATATGRHWAVAGALVAVFVGVCVTGGRVSKGARRAAFLGAAAGALFGVNAVLTKALVHYLGDGLFAWVPHWEPYVLVVSALSGLVVAQSALQTGALGASVGAIETLTVLTGSLLGIALLDEQVGAGGALEAVVIAVAMVAIVTGIIGLARAEEHLVGDHEDRAPVSPPDRRASPRS